MDYDAEPLPPGILPNFPPNYPFKWRHKLMPDPHPNELRSLGLPTAFSSYGRPRRDYGGYENCQSFDAADRNALDDQQQAMQEEYWEELMLQQNIAQENVQLPDMNGPPQLHMQDYPGQHHWGEGQTRQWRKSSNPQGHYFNSEFNDVHFTRRANWFRGQNCNSRGGRSGNFERGNQMNVRSSQKCDIRHPSRSQSSGKIFVPSKNLSSCEPSEEEEDFQQGRLWYSDEYAAFDDDPDWSCDVEEANASGQNSSQFSLSAPVPSSIDHYYNLAPQKPTEKRTNSSGSVANRELAIARKLNYLRRQFRERVCEVCVIGFPRIEQYNKHLRSHAKCMYPGCQFEACIEVLDGHITREHLLNPAVNTPISDEEYRRHRRNKYPTQAKKELQQAMVELQKKRGELLGIKFNKIKKDFQVESSKVGDDAGKVRVKKRLSPTDDKKLKKLRVEKPLKIVDMSQNPHETDDNFFVYKRIPEFRGTDAFDEEMGVKNCFADTLQNGDVLLADVPAFHISDDDEDMDLAFQKGDEMSSSLLQGKPSIVHATDGEDAVKNASDLITVHEELPSAHLASVSEKTAKVAMETAIREVDPPMCGGALGLLIGDYGSASDSENETSEDTKLKKCSSKSPVINDRDQLSSRQRGRVMDAETDEPGSKNMNTDGSTKLNDEADYAGTQLKVGKKNRHRRGKRGLKKRNNPTNSSGATQADTSFDKSALTLDRNDDCEEVNVKRSCASSSVSGHHTSKSCMTATSTAENQLSLFPHLKAINSRCDLETDDYDEDDAIVVEKPWHVRNEEALAARCISQKYKKFRSKYRVSLLEKLLQDEVRFERNVLLQCAKHIVDHKFFEDKKENENSKKDQAEERAKNSGDVHSDDSQS